MKVGAAVTHVDWAEMQRERIRQTGLQNYLATRG